MAVDYVNSMKQLGTELRILRKIQAAFEHHKLSSVTNSDKALLDGTYDDAVDEESTAKIEAARLLQTTLANRRSGDFTTYRTRVENTTDGFFRVLRGEFAVNETDDTAGAIDYDYELDDVTGAVKSLIRQGYLAALRRNMTTDAQTIKENTVTFGALVPESGNQGKALLDGAVAGDDHTLTGTILIECTDQNPESTKFDVELEFTNEIPGEIRRVADNDLILGQAWLDGPTGLTFKLKLDALVETGDDGNMLSANVVTTPKDADTDAGDFFVRVTRNAGDIWLIEVFSDDTLSTEVFDSVTAGDSPVGVVGTDSKTYTFTNGTVWAFNFDKANAATKLPVVGNSDSNIVISIQNPHIGDLFKIAVTNDEAGEFATKIARTWPTSLPSAAVPTITDADASSITIS